MALVALGGGITDMRGSVGGTKFSRSMAGAIAMHRVKGVNRRTNLQNAVRGRNSALSIAWSKTLDSNKRLAWRDWALATGWTNRLGASIQVTGLSAFIAVNGIRMLDGSNYLPDPPTLPGKAGAAPVTATIVGATNQLNITAIGGAWGPTTGNDIVHFFVGLPQSKGVLGSGKNMRYLGSVEGAPGGTPLPKAFTLPYTPLAGQPVTLQSVHIDATYRPGTREQIVVVPS